MPLPFTVSPPPSPSMKVGALVTMPESEARLIVSAPAAAYHDVDRLRGRGRAVRGIIGRDDKSEEFAVHGPRYGNAASVERGADNSETCVP